MMLSSWFMKHLQAYNQAQRAQIIMLELADVDGEMEPLSWDTTERSSLMLSPCYPEKLFLSVLFAPFLSSESYATYIQFNKINR